MKTSYVTTLLLSFFSLVEGNVDVLIDKFPKQFHNFQDICKLIDKEKGAYNKKLLCETKIFAGKKQKQIRGYERLETAKCLICRRTCEADQINKATNPSDSQKEGNTKNMSDLIDITKKVYVRTKELCEKITKENAEQKCAISLFNEEKYKIDIHVHSLCRQKCLQYTSKTLKHKFQRCIYEDKEEL